PVHPRGHRGIEGVRQLPVGGIEAEGPRGHPGLIREAGGRPRYGGVCLFPRNARGPVATGSDVIRVALSQKGYKGGRDNDNKYGCAYGVTNTARCAQFVWWCMREAGATGLLPKTAWCPDILIYARNNGLILRDPVKGNRTKSGFKPGDVGLIQRRPGEANYSPNGAKHIFLVVKDL